VRVRDGKGSKVRKEEEGEKRGMELRERDAERTNPSIK
jgi:hypothetical protein